LVGQDATPAAPPDGSLDTSSDRRMTRGSGRFVMRGDLIGAGWVVVAGLAILVPIAVHGKVLGPFDLLSRIGLTKQPGVKINSLEYGDVIDSLIPWSTMVWHQVHQGHLPLWNPFGGFGMPLAFNWQSAPFSLSAAVGYLVPVRYAFTVGVAVNLVVAGTGAYVLGRVLGLGVVASATVGTVFELSGPIAAWLGYPFPSVMSWAGWIFAFGLLVARGRHRAGYIVALALCVAGSLYGGAPEGSAVLALAAAVLFAFVLVPRARWAGGSGPILRPVLDLVTASVAGMALSAPFVLPGLQLSATSVRSLVPNGVVLSPHALLYLAFQGFDGLPLAHNGHVVVFGDSAFYTETAMYVGISALVLGGIGIALNRRRREVQGFVAVTVVCLALVFVPSVVTVAHKVPLLSQISLDRALMPMALALAVLAGYGIDAVVRTGNVRHAARWLGVGFGIAGVSLVALWVFGRGHLTPVEGSIRAHSFIWPVSETVVGLGVAAFLLWVGRQRPRPVTGSTGSTVGYRRRQWTLRWSGTIAGVGLLAFETAFLVSAGTTMMQSSSTSFPQTAATRALASEVGAATVASGSRTCLLGIAPNINAVYGIHQIGIYDPIIPKKYFSAWTADTGTPAGNPELNLFCPAVYTVSVARQFGVGYVLEALGTPGPTGSVRVRQLGDEVLYRIPGSGQATVAPLRGGRLPPDRDPGTPVAVEHPSPSTWKLSTSSDQPQAVRFHLSDVPGWHATIDGEPLPLESYAGLMLQARIPAGSHTIVLHYWPQTLTEGIVLALVGAAYLAGLLAVTSYRRRRGRPAHRVDPSKPAAPST
jgi:hypothetical protein